MPSSEAVVFCKNNIQRKTLVKDIKAYENDKRISQCNVKWHFPIGQKAIPIGVSIDQYFQHRNSMNQEKKKWEKLGFLDEWFDQWNAW